MLAADQFQVSCGMSVALPAQQRLGWAHAETVVAVQVLPVCCTPSPHLSCYAGFRNWFCWKITYQKTNCFLGRPGPHSSSPHEHSLCWGAAPRQEAGYFIFLLLVNLLFKRKIFDQVSLGKITHNLEVAVLWSWSRKPWFIWSMLVLPWG